MNSLIAGNAWSFSGKLYLFILWKSLKEPFSTVAALLYRTGRLLCTVDLDFTATYVTPTQ